MSRIDAIAALTNRTSQRANHEGYELVHGNYYSQLPNQQHMLEVRIRTATYQSSGINNLSVFMVKVVLGVGAGSGILAFFAAQAGARKVYAVKATSMVEYASLLVTANGLADRIQVIKSKVEAFELPEEDVALGTSGFKLFVRVFFNRGVVVLAT